MQTVLNAQKFVKVAQKWIEKEQVTDLTTEVTTLAYEKSLKSALEIAARLNVQDPIKHKYTQTWIQISYFSGFLAGWKDYKILNPHYNLITDENSITRVDWAEKYATEYAMQTSIKIFDKLLSPPVSPIISDLGEQHVKFLRETHERSLFAGYLHGLEQAFVERDKLISNITDKNIKNC